MFGEQALIKDVTLTKVDSKTFALNFEGKIFYIGEVLYDIIGGIKENKPKDNILDDINEKYNSVLTASEFDQLIADTNTKLTNSFASKSTLYIYIYGRLKIIGEEKLKRITPYFEFFFQKYLVALVAIGSLWLTIYFMGYMFTNGLIGAKVSLKQGAVYILLNYLFIIFIGLFHELGHSTASSKYGIHSKEVGFGFYFVFPVFYTDISRIWLLNRSKRIVINLGGIYFQMILSIIIISLYFLAPGTPQVKLLLKTLFLSNLSLSVFSLNPFMRNDGYWVYSDLFNIPNLTSRAAKYPAKFYNSYFRKASPDYIPDNKWQQFRKEIPLLIYSLGYNIITPLLYLALVLFTWKNVVHINEILHNKEFIANPFHSGNIIELIKSVLSIGINIFFVYKTFLTILKKYKND